MSYCPKMCIFSRFSMPAVWLSDTFGKTAKSLGDGGVFLKSILMLFLGFLVRSAGERFGGGADALLKRENPMRLLPS